MSKWVRVALVVGLALGMAGTASAQYTLINGVNLSWTECGAGGAVDQTFACGVNTGSNQAVASFIAPANAVNVVGGGTVVDLVTVGVATLEPWWQTYAGGCRANGTSINYDEAAFGATCADMWQGGASAGIPVSSTQLNGSGRGANTLRIRSGLALTAGVALNADEETFLFYLNVSHSKTVGTGLCTGCLTPVCIVLNEIALDQPAANGQNWKISGAPLGGRDYVTWQGAGQVDCAIVPTHNRTWGQIKGLYR
jgi:hypothetical protein